MSSDKPTVLIVGAGLGGLMLGALLEKANIPYAIFERTSVVKPLGKTTLSFLFFSTPSVPDSYATTNHTSGATNKNSINTLSLTVKPHALASMINHRIGVDDWSGHHSHHGAAWLY